MEDDEEIQSHASHNTDEDDDEHVNVDVVVEQSKQQIENVENSRQSPPISGGVTVAVVPTTSTSTADVSGMSTPPPPSSSLTLALPIQQNSARVAVAAAVSGGGISYGRDDCWSEAATAVLIEAWGERYMELSRGNLKQKHWKEVADIVSSRDDFGKIPKTDIQCKNRIDTVKKKYKVEKSKVVAGCGPSRWPFYDRIDHLIGPTAAANSAGKAAAVVAAVYGSGNGGIIPEAVPVGIPFGIRHQQMSLPFPSYGSPQLRPPPHLQPPQPQPLSMRHVFPTPVRFNHHNVNPNYANNVRHHQMMQQQQQQQQQQQFRRSPMVAQQAAPPQQPAPPAVESEEEAGGWSNESEDSLPPETGYERRKKRARTEATTTSVGGRMKKNKGVREWGKSVRELTRAILKFGEAYEMAESAKLEHIVEMEKQRMKFAKELELQRMKFLMKTQLELSQFNTTVVGSENGVGSSTRRGNGGGSGGGNGGGVENNHVH